MAWKQINGRRYYYRSIREGGRVRSEYVGSGEVAELTAQVDEINRGDRLADREARKEERKQADEQERYIAEWFDQVEDLASAAMQAAGFHRHHRGEWRRRRR